MKKRMKTENTNSNAVARVAKVKKGLRITRTALIIASLAMTTFAPSVFADDPLAAINGLSTFIFSAIKAIGMILLGFGIVQIGLSLKSHDAQQRANGFLTFFGGIVIAFAKDILDMIL